MRYERSVSLTPPTHYIFPMGVETPAYPQRTNLDLIYTYTPLSPGRQGERNPQRVLRTRSGFWDNPQRVLAIFFSFFFDWVSEWVSERVKGWGGLYTLSWYEKNESERKKRKWAVSCELSVLTEQRVLVFFCFFFVFFCFLLLSLLWLMSEEACEWKRVIRTLQSKKKKKKKIGKPSLPSLDKTAHFAQAQL